MSEPRMFPIQTKRGAKPHPLLIPWSVAELAYSVYAAQYGRSQTLERLAQRGGFGPGEMDEYLPDWRERCSEITTLTARLAAAEAENEQLWQFVAELPCECRGEFPNKCDRCTLIEAAKGGRDEDGTM